MSDEQHSLPKEDCLPKLLKFIQVAVCLVATSFSLLMDIGKQSNSKTKFYVEKLPSAILTRYISGSRLQIWTGEQNVTVQGEELVRFADSNAFYVDTDGERDGVCFAVGDSVPLPGSGSSKYPRVELRRKNEWFLASDDVRRFKSHKFQASGNQRHIQTGNVKIISQPSSGKTIFAQIHGEGSGSEALKLEWKKGSVVAGVKAKPNANQENLIVTSGLALGDEIKYKLEVQGAQLRVTVNGESVEFVYDEEWAAVPVYFKAGNYLQDNSGKGSMGVVLYFELEEEL